MCNRTSYVIHYTIHSIIGGVKLKHSSNIIIELPEDNPSKAFYKIVELENKYGLLNKRLKKIDLRISDRMIIQLKNKSELLKENGI